MWKEQPSTFHLTDSQIRYVFTFVVLLIQGIIRHLVNIYGLISTSIRFYFVLFVKRGVFSYMLGLQQIVYVVSGWHHNSPVSNSPWPLNKRNDNAFLQG